MHKLDQHCDLLVRGFMMGRFDDTGPYHRHYQSHIPSIKVSGYNGLFGVDGRPMNVSETLDPSTKNAEVEYFCQTAPPLPHPLVFVMAGRSMGLDYECDNYSGNEEIRKRAWPQKIGAWKQRLPDIVWR